MSRTIVGVLSQTFAGVEVVVVDDGSDDDTLDVVRMLADSRVRVLRHDRSRDGSGDDGDGGPDLTGAARAQGFRSCTGSWATTLDPGDEVHPGWLARMGRLTDSTGASFVSCGGTQRFSDMSEASISPIPVPEMDDVRACLRSGSFMAPTSFFRELPPSRLDDLVGTGIAIIDEVVGAGGRCIATPEPLIRWSEGLRTERAATDEERQLSRLMAALETLALTPIPDGQLLARYAAMGGELAGRLGHHADSRKLFAIARDTLPRVPRYWMDWAGSLVPFRTGSANG